MARCGVSGGRRLASGAALVWGSLDRRPRGAASSGRHWSGRGVASTGVYRPGPRAAKGWLGSRVEFASAPSSFLACVAWRHASMRPLQPVHGLQKQRGSFKRGPAKPATSSKNARYATRFGPYSCSVTKRHCSRDSFGPTKLSRRTRAAAVRYKPLFSSITKNICCAESIAHGP